MSVPADLFDRLPTGRDTFSFFVPGRLEFLGKHTDYAGGRSLVAAIDRGIAVAARPRADRQVIIHDVGLDLETRFEIGPDLEIVSGWAGYAMAVARRLARNFGSSRGADIHFASNLPSAAGLSSSSALVTGFFHALAAANRVGDHPSFRRDVPGTEERAEYLGAMENGAAHRSLDGDQGVGTAGGCQDHAAILLSQPGALLQCRFGPLRQEAILPVPPDLTFVIAVSGVAAEKTGPALAAYNRIPRLTARLFSIWNAATGRADTSILAAVDGEPDAHARWRAAVKLVGEGEFGQADLLARLEQVVMESTVLVPDAAAALESGDLAALGETVDLSQLLAERMLGNQVPETITLARLAREQGAVAASAFGAGFGGSVYALVGQREAEDFRRRWGAAYLGAFVHRKPQSEFFLTDPGPPLTAAPQ